MFENKMDFQMKNIWSKFEFGKMSDFFYNVWKLIQTFESVLTIIQLMLYLMLHYEINSKSILIQICIKTNCRTQKDTYYLLLSIIHKF